MALAASQQDHHYATKRTKFCDQRNKKASKCDHVRAYLFTTTLSLYLAVCTAQGLQVNGSSIIIDQQQQQQLLQYNSISGQTPGHLQPSFVYGSRNRSINVTHLTLDELTGSVYVGATNWLLQLSLASLRPEVALRTGPTLEDSRACAPADCLAPPSHVDPSALALQHAPGLDLATAGRPAWHVSRPGATMHTGGAANGSHAFLAAPRSPKGGRPASSQQQQQLHNNNYNKILALEPDSRQLIVCGSLNQGACRRHQLGQLSNFSELVPLPVASNDELSSSVALMVPGKGKQAAVMYVAATNSRLGPYRDMVPSISARHLEPAARAFQIIERSFTDSARVDVSFELRDYYLINYVHAFQHNDYVYFATVQRRSPLRQLEEWGYITRLARLCLNDLSFQSYAEMTLECSRPPGGGHRPAAGEQRQASVNYNLLQDAQVSQASSQLAQQLGIRPQAPILVGLFAQSKDHTTKTANKSALCIFPMDSIEQRFQDNIHSCLNGSSRARNMNYIAGSVNDCPKPGLQKANLANLCNEPIKLNGSLPLVGQPVASYDNELLTAVAVSQAPTSPVSLAAGERRPQSSRQHQVLMLGTGSGALKRLVLPAATGRAQAHEFDSVQLAEEEPVLADLHLHPAANPQLAAAGDQFAILATPSRVAKFRVNGCKLSGRPRATNASAVHDECSLCARTQDPFCGWCAHTQSCNSRDECLAAGPQQPIHWSPFDQIRCQDYQPVSPQLVALQQPQVGGHPQQVDVNVRLQLAGRQTASLASQLAPAQFTCHFDYLALANRSSQAHQRVSGATTKASQARLNPHSSTLVLGCPLPPTAQRPPSDGTSELQRVKLTVRGQDQQRPLELLLGGGPADELLIERELAYYDCSVHTSCRGCLAGQATDEQPAGQRGRAYSCVWCPLSQRCTFNGSHPDFGCAASAIGPLATTPQSLPALRPAHLASALDQAQASVLGAWLDRIAQCPAAASAESATRLAGTRRPGDEPVAEQQPQEILVPSGARRSIQVNLRQPAIKLQRAAKLECQLELEGAKARVGARLLDNQLTVVCQEGSFSYQEEQATQRGQLLVVMNDNQVLDSFEVTLYKCHLFGVSPPALVSAVAQSGGLQHSSAAWRAHELLQWLPRDQQQQQQVRRRQPDCSLCLNVDRKYQCAWCAGQCQPSDQCQELAASTCPPPRIDSIQPSSGPLEGGTLLTIEGSNLGSNEREIQDKISVAGEPCQLVMYSVSTRIVCKTPPAGLHGPQTATVFVGNRAGVSSAHEKFHYKAVHLTDVQPRIGPASGGTRLYLSGTNLNVGSRVQIFLDDIPCAFDSHEVSSQQISCITAPNLLASSMRITRLTLIIDNSTHHLPFPFTYQPDPIITNIEPAESFVSGGRLILITGHHLASPQSAKLMVYHEHKHQIINATSCITQNDTLLTCLTPAISRDLVANLLTDQNLNADGLQPLSYEAGGLKLRMSLFMDDVRSVRNLDEYYHHLPHHLTYFEDPILFRLARPVIDYSPELVIPGENLRMRQLDQDILVTIGSYVCAVKSVGPQQIVCEPPAKIAPVVDDANRIQDRPLLAVVALVGSNLRYQIGHMQYSSNQYQLNLPDMNNQPGFFASSYPMHGLPGDVQLQDGTAGGSPGVAILVSLSILGFIVGLGAAVAFALSRFRHSKAEREYKRIQLQMGSLDANGQPIGGLFTDNVHHLGSSAGRTRAPFDYVNGTLTGKRLFYHLNQPSFPPSPLTDISSLTGSNPLVQNNKQQHVIKLNANGTIVNSTAAQQPIYNSANTNSSSSQQSSPGSTAREPAKGLYGQNSFMHQSPQQHLLGAHHGDNKTGLNLLATHQTNPSSRNFNWTQEAPSTIVPYAVIEACNLTLEGKNTSKEFV